MKRFTGSIPILASKTGEAEYDAGSGSYFRFRIISLEKSPRTIGEVGVVAKNYADALVKAKSKAIALNGPNVQVSFKGEIKI